MSRALDKRSGAKSYHVKSVGSKDGIVNFCVHGTSSALTLCERPPGRNTSGEFTATKIIQGIQKGLPFEEFEVLQSILDISAETLAPKLGISKATLHRRKAEGRLAPEESDHVVRFARLFGKALEVLETEENARKWLASPQVGLGGAIPLDFAETEVGAREVEDLLGRIEFSVYS